MLRPAMLNFQLSALCSQLRRYFYSGWAFFIPYLAVYLLYAWLKWPVNPASQVAAVANGSAATAGSWIFLILTLIVVTFLVRRLMRPEAK